MISTKLDTRESTQPASIDQHQHGVGRHSSRTDTKLLTPPQKIKERVYRPKVPHYKNRRKSKQKQEDARCKAIMDKLIVEIPLIDAVKTSSMIRRYVKRMVTKDINIEQGVMMISAQVSAIIQNKIPEKLPDPGSFVLDCSIFNEKFSRSLCDLGSSVSLIPQSVAVNLGMTDCQPTWIILILADRSIQIPDGVLEDVPVKIGNCLIPTDFVVLKNEEEPKDPLILGHPFLVIADAMIDVRRGWIGLNYGFFMMNFDMEKLVTRPTIDEQNFYVDTLTNLAEEIFKDTDVDDPLERALTASRDEIEYLDDVAAGYAKLMDANEQVMKLVTQEALAGNSVKARKSST
ncbi:hypothetical protein V5N11_003548 [Cardamine amara subsp. amara]|uniref:Uncharacterized protein n=1 Tax=Cardamine amara subsp. amara TaxID=228776 RepID=A0ABD1C1Z5_CARAN